MHHIWALLEAKQGLNVKAGHWWKWRRSNCLAFRVPVSNHLNSTKCHTFESNVGSSTYLDPLLIRILSPKWGQINLQKWEQQFFHIVLLGRGCQPRSPGLRRHRHDQPQGPLDPGRGCQVLHLRCLVASGNEDPWPVHLVRLPSQELDRRQSPAARLNF